ncbi:MAG: hypothetical protein IPG46_19920 [Actinobacteria bacterium]|nr:hypothetical protein [Actinomycetota bacterium]
MSAPGWPTLPDGRYAVLRTHRADGASYGGFRWPTEVGGVAVAPDWDPDPSIECGHGLHGLLWGCGDGSLLTPSLTWAIVAVDPGDIATRIDMGVPPKVRFRSAEVIHVGDRGTATGWIAAHGGAGLPVVYGTATAGDGGTATAGDGGTATAGDGGTATAGYGGTATAGNGGTATAGYRGTATAGDGGTATAGDDGTATAGDGGTATAGYGGTATAGDGGTATAGDGGTATAGYGGTATAGDGGTATAGDRGSATAGYRGTATAGYRGTATAGYDGTATAGDGGVLIIHRYDSGRRRLSVGQVDGVTLLPDTPYRLDAAGEFEAVA